MHNWEEAVRDARNVMEERCDKVEAQTYLSKVQGLFNICLFEEVR